MNAHIHSVFSAPKRASRLGIVETVLDGVARLYVALAIWAVAAVMAGAVAWIVVGALQASATLFRFH